MINGQGWMTAPNNPDQVDASEKACFEASPPAMYSRRNRPKISVRLVESSGHRGLGTASRATCGSVSFVLTSRPSVVDISFECRLGPQQAEVAFDAPLAF